MRLPPAVRAAALVAVGGTRLQKELAWMSWAGTVWRLEGQSGVVYVKRARDLEGERDRTVWMAGAMKLLPKGVPPVGWMPVSASYKTTPRLKIWAEGSRSEDW